MYKLEKLMTNPLIQAYRKPNMYVALPSGGRFYKDKPTLSADNELAVYAMTARDELITKTPDALFNGEATVSLIKSCCPDIKDPNNMPVSDLLVILVGIRQASFGKDIDIDVKCPKCEHQNQLTLNASAMLSNTKSTTSDQEVVIQDDIKLTCNPYTLHDRTTLQVQQIKQQKMITSLADSKLDDAGRQELFGKTFVEIAELTVALITNSISSVNANGDTIVDKDMIKEWLQTITKADYDKVKSKIEELSESGLETAFNAKCQECQHEWKTGVDLDIANFFVG
jgi:DNA-directed RNA polymerase subunit M/transcription elongation factor TFIIS